MKDKLLKVTIWRAISVSITFLVLFLMTGDVKSATGTTVFLHVLLMTCHLVFESFWEKKNERRR